VLKTHIDPGTPVLSTVALAENHKLAGPVINAGSAD
jgi:hypothetical protein